jgi:nucleoside 2-deoxyribosyltransferase
MKLKIYLAGGFGGTWQSDIVNELNDLFDFFNPKVHSLKNPKEYTEWDLFYVDRCDILLGYMSSDNPSGYGLALEIGYAKAKNKLILLVDERSRDDQTFQRYFAICRNSSNVVFDSLSETIVYLKTFIY